LTANGNSFQKVLGNPTSASDSPHPHRGLNKSSRTNLQTTPITRVTPATSWPVTREEQMKRTMVLVPALLAVLAIGASAQVKVKAGVGPGKGTGANGPAKLGPMTGISPKTTGKTTGTPTSGKPAQVAPGGQGEGSGTQGPAKGVAPSGE
jgi:hypothetical protein